MTDYSLPEPGNVVEIGRRAKRLRDLLGMSVEATATAAGVAEEDVAALEAGDAVALAAALAIHQVLSTDAAGAILFTRPRLRSIDDVEAFERRRLASL